MAERWRHSNKTFNGVPSKPAEEKNVCNPALRPGFRFATLGYKRPVLLLGVLLALRFATKLFGLTAQARRSDPAATATAATDIELTKDQGKCHIGLSCTTKLL